jgi:hypothetical protein
MEEKRMIEATHEVGIADRRAVFNPTEFTEPNTETNTNADADLLTCQPLHA